MAKKNARAHQVSHPRGGDGGGLEEPGNTFSNAAMSSSSSSFVSASNGSSSSTTNGSIPLNRLQTTGLATSNNLSTSKRTLSPSSGPDLRQRRQPASPKKSSAQEAKRMDTPSPKPRRSWLFLALLSGAFAALNGGFAKLTTTSLTSSLTHTLASIFLFSTDPSSAPYRILDIVIRGTFFGLNLVSNGIMWALFTRALTAHSSATQVSILNTSANFLVTAVLGVGVFGERLGGLWFAGAACLVFGNVVIGRKAVAESDGGETEMERDGIVLRGGVDLVADGEGEESGDREDHEWDALLEVDEDEAERRGRTI